MHAKGGTGAAVRALIAIATATAEQLRRVEAVRADMMGH